MTIDWERLTHDAALDPPDPKVAESWSQRAKQEHLAVGAFSLIARELAEVGCEPVVLSLVTRAANDEVRHAEICARMAACLTRQPFATARYKGVPREPAHDGADASTRALLHVVEMCCLSETFTGVCMTEMLARATHPVAHAVVQSLLKDEIDHGKVGWAYLAERTRDGTVGDLATALPELAVRTMRAAMRPALASTETDEPELERWAYLAPSTLSRLYREAFTDVIARGFEHLGVDVEPTRARLRSLDWL